MDLRQPGPERPFYPLQPLSIPEILRFRVSGFGFRVSGFGFRVCGLFLWVSFLWLKVEDWGGGAQCVPNYDSGVMTCGSGLRVWCLWCVVECKWLRVKCRKSGFRVELSLPWWGGEERRLLIPTTEPNLNLYRNGRETLVNTNIALKNRVY